MTLSIITPGLTTLSRMKLRIKALDENERISFFILSVIVLNINMLNVVAPFEGLFQCKKVFKVKRDFVKGGEGLNSLF